MASKRQRGEMSRSQASEPYDRRPFVSEATSERYHSLSMGKSLIPERGIMPHETQDFGVAVMIAERGWENFTVQPEPAVVAIVKEFYANAKEARNNVVQIRGKSGAFDRASINAYYRTVAIDDDEFIEYRQEELDWDQVIKYLCGLGQSGRSRESRLYSLLLKFMP